MTHPGAEITVDRLVKRFETGIAVDAITFDVHSGEMFGLIGPDGAGKTTTLRSALGLLRPDSGSVRTCGRDPWRERRRLSREVGYQAQSFSLYGDLSVDENIAFFASVHAVRDWRPRRDDLLDLLRMTEFRSRLAERLSGGMKQKLALACTLIHTPRVLILDEPTTGVDPVSRRDFWRILAGLRREGMTILVTTPYLDEAERCERVALMDRGRIIALDRPETLRASLPGSLVEVVARPVGRARDLLSSAPGVEDVQTFGERLHARLSGVSTLDAVEAARAVASSLVAAGIEVEGSRPITPSLEDVFIATVAGSRRAAKEARP